MKIRVKKIHPDAIIPTYKHPGDAGMDLHTVRKGKADKYGNMVYETGLAFEIPEGYVGLIYPRSSVSKTPHSLRNHVGVIDSGYRGEVVFKFGWVESASEDAKVYDKGDRIGQIIIMPYPKVEFVESYQLSETERGEGGFGSTGQ